MTHPKAPPRCSTCAAPLTNAATAFLHSWLHEGAAPKDLTIFHSRVAIPAALYSRIAFLMQAYADAQASHALAVWRAAKQLSALLDEVGGESELVDFEVWDHFWHLVDEEEL